MVKRMFFIIIFLSIFYTVGFANSVRADDHLKAVLQTEPNELTVGDPILVTLSVTHPADYQVIFPDLGNTWGEFTVNDQSPPSSIQNADGSKTTTQIIDLRYFSPGKFYTPALPVQLSDSQGQLEEIIAEPLPITISSVLVEGDQQLRDIKPQASLPFLNPWPWVIALLGIGMVAGVTGYMLHRRRHSSLTKLVDKRKPHEFALDELERIEELHLPEKGAYKEHYTLISNCIRSYIEKRYDIPVIEHTTREIRSSVKKSDIPENIGNQFINLLEESDLVKFSTFKPDAGSAKLLLESGRWIVEETIPSLIETRPSNTDEFNLEAGITDLNTNSIQEGRI